MVQRRYFVLTTSGELGPHDHQELRDLLRAGTIAPGDRLRTALGASAGTVAQLLNLPAGGEDQSNRASRSAPSGGVPSPRPRQPTRTLNDPPVRGVRGQTRVRTATRQASEAEGEGDVEEDEDDGAAEVRGRPAANRPPIALIAIVAVVVVAGIAWYLFADAPRPVVAPTPQVESASTLPSINLEPRETAWYTGVEGAAILRLSAPSSTPLVVPLLVGGTAIPGVDVSTVPTQVTVPAGTTSLAVPVMALVKSIKRSPPLALTIAVDPSGGGGSGGRAWKPGTRASTTIPVQMSDRGVTWLSTLPLADSWCAYRSPGIDTSFGNGVMTLQGQTYEHGISLHPGEQAGEDAWVVIKLDGKYDEFLCDVGIDDEAGEAGSCVFQVQVDGRVRADTGLIERKDPPRQVRVPVGGAKELKLVVTYGNNGSGNNNSSDHADWAGARLVKR